MPKYLVQRYLSDSGWCRDKEFEALDDEHAKKEVMALLNHDRLSPFTDEPIRISRQVFEGPPSATGYPYPHDSGIEELESRLLASQTERWMQVRSTALDYDDLNFAIRKVGQPLDGAGYDMRLLYEAGYGFMGSANEEEVKHALEVANLSPGDITISAYYYDGPEGPRCVSVSKVLKFAKGGKIPTKLIHLWPLEFPNFAIDPKKLASVKIEDKRS